jgi:monofunctional biosynthetic peptidoglycan transglycosylase
MTFRQGTQRLLLGCLALLLLYQFWLLGWVLWWKWVNPDETRFMSIRLAELRVDNPQAQLKKQWVSYDHISANLKRAIIAAEDAKFVDTRASTGTASSRRSKRTRRRGASSPAGRRSRSNWPRISF